MPSCLIKAFFTVEKMIRISSKKLIFWIYFKSQLIFSSQEMEFRPLICANPERPGLAVCRILCSSDINTMSRTSCGRGPIMDIVPFRILKASGSSSKLVFRSHFPNLVRRTSSGRRSPFSSRSSVMVRNLYILNTVSFPSGPISPGRSCVNSTGDPNFVFTRIATPRYSGLNTTIAPVAQITSTERFTYFS